ncbi:YggT family protein [Yoonia sp. I 8.24]|uniref:YggT family protein n=1 Tax=Yoonia sp. I 8.24 TaxID=1537229 RepID=UPI001EDF242D|nr:YggT family protein [Yoonia sp. I 8.24]MCG3269153.1 YggT family protein [Yoonia sp. I 8.24]
MLTIIQILLLLIGVVRFFVIAHFIMSWLIRFEVLNVRQEFVGQVWYGLQRILEPIYSRVRRFMPDLGGVDLSPIVVLVGLEILRIFLYNNAAAFAY